MTNADRFIARVASRQHGVFSHRQATAVGFTRHQIAQRRTSGAWINLARGVYALDSAPATWHRQVMAAVLSKNRARASGMTAGVLHEIPHCRMRKPEIAVPATGNAYSHIAIVRRRSSFTNLGQVLIGGIPATDVPNTLFDIATQLTPSHLRRAIDDSLIRGKITADELRTMLDRHAGCRLAGTVAYREAVRDITDAYVPPESDLEILLVAALDDPRIPSLDLQARLPWWNELPHRVDAVVRPWSLIIEGDGRPYHTKRDDFESDRRRDNLAVANGYRVLRFTYRMLADDPAGVLETVLRAGSRSTAGFTVNGERSTRR